MAEAEPEDRSLAPSQKRLNRAREEGQAPLSRELTAFAALGGAALILSLGGPAILRGVAARLQSMLAVQGATAGDGLRAAAAAFGVGVFGLATVLVFTSAAAVLLQSGFLLHLGALAPKASRLSPAAGLKRVFGGATLQETGKALAKLAVLGWALWQSWSVAWPSLGEAVSWTSAQLMERLGRDVMHILLLVLGAQAAIALADVAWTRWRFHQKLRMSRQDHKEEAKEEDGDPRVKGRLRQLRQARSKRRMLAAVAKATVVVTNPTHYAVALAYERGKGGAPRVVAKGVDEAAARIRGAAEKAGVPLVPNPPLARALYLVPLEREVPEEHFRLVAEIIAYVWRLRGQRSGG